MRSHEIPRASNKTTHSLLPMHMPTATLTDKQQFQEPAAEQHILSSPPYSDQLSLSHRHIAVPRASNVTTHSPAFFPSTSGSQRTHTEPATKQQPPDLSPAPPSGEHRRKRQRYRLTHSTHQQLTSHIPPTISVKYADTVARRRPVGMNGSDFKGGGIE